MKKLIIIVLILFTQNIFSQEYFAKCTITSNYWTNGVLCGSDRYYKNLKIISPINVSNHYYSSQYVKWYYSGSFTIDSYTLYSKVNKYNYISLECNTTDFGESYEYLDTYINGIQTYPQQSYTTYKSTGWNPLTGLPTCFHHGKVTFQVTTYDAAEIKDINGSVGGTHCISSINDNITINLPSVSNPGSSALYLRVYTATNTLIKEKYLGTYSASKSVKFSDLNLQNYWGQDVYFQIRSSLGGQNIYSDKIGATFFRQIPEPTINVRQRACEPYVLFDMTLDTETINDIANYEFRICKKDDESSSNVYELEQYGNITGNTITLKADNFIPADNTTYTIQIYQDVHGSPPPPMNEISCARDIVVSLGFKPDTIAFSNVLTEYTFTDYQNITHTYHITRNGLSNGKATLSLTEDNDLRLNRFQVKKNDIPFWKDINVQPYDPGIYLYQNLDAGDYLIRAIDKDGCMSSEDGFKIIRPDPLVINNINSTLVSCHQNNTGTGSHSDAQITTEWNGGIGTYNLSVKNAASEVVFEEQNINTYDKQTLDNLPVGDYELEISDNYGAVASGSITVESNPEVILTATAKDCQCNGSGNGKIKLEVENSVAGNVTFYLTNQPEINTNVDTALFEYLEVGTYNAMVTNAKNCEDIINDLVINQPNVLELSGSTTNPICYNSYEGSIITNTAGGNGNYQYLWSNGETTPNINNLNNGSYTLTVTDAEGCSNQEFFEIIPPPAPTAGWNETSAILCTGNTLTLDGGDFVSYEWKKNGITVSTERNYTLRETGTYTLTITNNSNCVNTETFELEMSDHTLDAVLLLQDSAGVNELTEVIDVTWPIPDSINWFFDKPVVLDESGSWYQQFLSEDEGIISVTLRAWSDGCFSDSSKTITIFNNKDIQEKQLSGEAPLILGFKVYPNPNKGDFKLAVKLSRQTDIQVKIFSLVKSLMIHDKIYRGLKNYEIPYYLNNLTKGPYIIILTAEKERQSLKFIIN